MAEEGADLVHRLLRSRPAATSCLSFVEIASALHRRRRLGDITRAELGRALATLAADEKEFLVIDMSREVSMDARELLGEFPLRASDAVQLASFRDLHRRIGGGATLVAWDRRLLSAASALGLPVEGG